MKWSFFQSLWTFFEHSMKWLKLCKQSRNISFTEIEPAGFFKAFVPLLVPQDGGADQLVGHHDSLTTKKYKIFYHELQTLNVVLIHEFLKYCSATARFWNKCTLIVILAQSVFRSRINTKLQNIFILVSSFDLRKISSQLEIKEHILAWLTSVSLCSLILLSILFAALFLAALLDLQATVRGYTNACGWCLPRSVKSWNI